MNLSVPISRPTADNQQPEAGAGAGAKVFGSYTMSELSTLLPFIVAHCHWISSSLMLVQLGHNQPSSTSLSFPILNLHSWPITTIQTSSLPFYISIAARGERQGDRERCSIHWSQCLSLGWRSFIIANYSDLILTQRRVRGNRETEIGFLWHHSGKVLLSTYICIVELVLVPFKRIIGYGHREKRFLSPC